MSGSGTPRVISAVTVEDPQLLFPDKVALPGGPSFASDHIGLAATVIVPD